ncbi:hypothetical protein RRG08_022097 [Elysia crispata]|uniref:Uncharacterized protein n=1 Tax=Elysia crispata TaxID=231223 RepID=A0AAE0Y2P7_9GAST|nr:hypothetical protein RRG08_022097 [Elysia crispata]
MDIDDKLVQLPECTLHHQVYCCDALEQTGKPQKAPVVCQIVQGVQESDFCIWCAGTIGMKGCGSGVKTSPVIQNSLTRGENGLVEEGKQVWESPKRFAKDSLDT